MAIIDFLLSLLINVLGSILGAIILQLLGWQQAFHHVAAS